MLNHKTTNTTTSPFFELLAEADEIKIREVRTETETKATSASAPQAKDEPNQRTFFVHIKTKPAETIAPADPAEPVGNRVYLLRSAELLVDDGDFILARNIYSYILKGNIRDPEALRGLGICFIRLGEVASAKKCFKALYEISRKDDSLLWLGQTFSAEGNDTEAIEYFSRISDPTTLTAEEQFELFREMGNSYTRVGAFDHAWSVYHRALQLVPGSEAVHLNLGTLELQRNHPEVALSYFNKALEINPRSSRAHGGLALVAIAREDNEKAARELTTALELDSQNLVALLQLVNIAQRTGSYTVAREHLETFLNKDPKNVEVRYALGVLLFKEGDWSRCARELDDLLSRNPDHAKARLLREELNYNKPTPA